MKIKDLNGCDVEVENLQLAIMQADDYSHYEHFDPKYKEADAERKIYWQDIYQKLVQLRET